MTSIASTSRRAASSLRSALCISYASSSTSNPPPPIRALSSSSSSDSSSEMQLTLALIKPSVCTYQPDVSSILKQIKASPLSIARTRRLFWTSTDAHAFYAEHRGRFYYDRLILGMISGPSLALALYGPNSIAMWRAMLGPTKTYMGKYTSQDTLRAKYGLGDTRNGFHGSDSVESAKRELGLVFDGWDTEWWLQREQGKLPVDGEGKVNPLGF